MTIDDLAAVQLWPINAAEKALHELEVYKTPLLPSRLKGAPIPDMFMPKKNRPIVLMHDRDRERKKGKGKSKMKDRDGVNGTKPYAGEGGMKKWLARRMREEDAVRVHEEAEKEKEKEQVMDEDENAEVELKEQQKKEQEEEAKRKKELEVRSILQAPVFEPQPSAPREMSSLRVGRSRNRNHIERPTSRRTNKFSAAFEDDEDAMDDDRAALEEAAKKAPVFEIPAGFTFAKEVTIFTSCTHEYLVSSLPQTPIPQDVVNAKEPPISALPFSLSKPTALASAARQVAELPAPTVPAVPTMSLAPPTPQPPKSLTPVSVPTVPVTTASGIPNFFANTAAFNKPLAVTTDSGSLGAPTLPLAPAQVPEAPKIPEASPSLFGTSARQATSISSVAPATTSVFGTTTASTSTSISGTSATTAGISFDTPAAPKEATPAEGILTLSSAPLPVTSSLPFSFGAPPPAVETSKAVEPKVSKPTFGAAPSASPCSFDAPVVPAPAAESSKPAFSFEQSALAPVTTESSNGAFSFGVSAPSTSLVPPPAPVIEAPKPLFGTQGSSATPGFSLGVRPSTAPAEEKPVSAPTSFSFGAPAPPAPAEKKSFTFGTPSPAPPAAIKPAFSFGPSNAGSNAADTSRSFSFGQPTPSLAPARPVTPPKAVQEISMDESPSRDMTPNGKAPERPTLDFSFNAAGNTPAGSTLFAQSPATTTGPGFGFGAASASPFAKPEDKDKLGTFGSGFGQTSGTGFGFGQKPPETSAPAPAAPFGFAQAASPSVAPASPFTFSQTASNPFGQQNTSSAPSSPSTFSRPAHSFSFGPTAPAQPSVPSFAFGGSQPVSPATPAGGLPQPSGGSFTFGQPSGAAPAAAPNPFAPPPAAAQPAGGTLFTIGAAPQSDGRQIKKLPRRGVGRR